MKPSKNSSIKRVKPLLGTWVTISVTGPDQGTANRAADAAFAAVEKVQRLMSAHDPLSEISLLSRQLPGQARLVDPWTYAVLLQSREISLASCGVFDVTVGARLEELEFLPRHSRRAPEPIKSTYTDIELLEDSRVSLHRPCRIDLGGIAKGFAADRAVDAAFQITGIEDVAVNAGGDLRINSSRPQPVWLRDPFAPGRLWPAGLLQDGAMASSGGVEAVREFREGRATPLLIPGKNRVQQLFPGITVAAPTCILADALTKVVALADTPTAAAALHRFKAKAWVADSKQGFREFTAIAKAESRSNAA